MQVIGQDRTNEDVEYQKTDKKSEDKAPHRRSYWVEKTRKKLGTKQNGQQYSFGQVNGLTSDWSVNKIKRRFNECKKADIPFAPLWHWKRNNE